MEPDPYPTRWSYRGYLPHFHCAEAIQFITFRLGDSLPKAVVERIEMQIQQMLPGEDEEIQAQRRKLAEKYLDSGYGSAGCVERPAHRLSMTRCYAATVASTSCTPSC
jgi:hypothetical protein